jgi:spore germination protein YaaH
MALANEPASGLSPHAIEALQRAAVAMPDDNDFPTAMPQPLVPRSAQAELCDTVFGYLPYWQRPGVIRWDLLTHLACFSIEVNQFGNVTNSRGWPWTSEINTAHANGVKVILVITLFDSAQLTTLLSTPAYRETLKQNILAKVQAGNADGVNLDFEDAGPWRNDYVSFLTELKAYLEAARPGCELTIAGPAVNWSGGWDLVGIANACDGIFIMGYAFNGSFSSSSGPNAPFTGGTYNITNTVVTQYAGVPPEKLILGVPYYGNHWITSTADARSTVIDHLSSPNFTATMSGAAQYGRIWDASSQTPWYRYFDGTNWHQVWYDDVESTQLKFQLAIDQGLQGIGMWALDYDAGRNELWTLIEDLVAGCYPCCDYNNDRQVNLTDFNTMKFCLQGPTFKFAPGHTCLKADTDGDLDVDMADFHTFEQAFGR